MHPINKGITLHAVNHMLRWVKCREFQTFPHLATLLIFSTSYCCIWADGDGDRRKENDTNTPLQVSE